MQTTSNYGLKKPEGTDVVDIQNFNDNADVIDINMKTINDNSYPNVTATGTNAYVGTTDRIKALVKGTKLTLFVTLDATGNCTLNLNTYGVKNIKDSFGNIVTNMKKDIPYNLCYNGTDFILQGKGGGGNVTADKVLSGYTFTNDSGQGTGTMTNISADQTASTITQSGTTVSLTVPNGYWDGAKKLNASATAIDSDIVSTNIRAGVNVCGVTGDSNIVNTFAGTANGGHIISGVVAFSKGTQITGTMPNYWNSWQYAQSVTPANGRLHMYPPIGYYDPAGGTGIYYDSPDFLASNIVSGKNIFGILGTATVASLGGRRVASGSQAATGNGASFTGLNGTVYSNFGYITVTGLSFKPSLVYTKAWAPGGLTYVGIYDELGLEAYPRVMKFTVFNTGYSGSSFTYNFKGDVGTASVINGSFTLPANLNYTITWIAFE